MSYDKWIVVKNSKTIFGRNMSTKVHQEIGLIFSEKKKKKRDSVKIQFPQSLKQHNKRNTLYQKNKLHKT